MRSGRDIKGSFFFAEEEEEVAVSEIRTVVRTERHVHDSENGERNFDTGGFEPVLVV